jgi:hypothetical protein
MINNRQAWLNQAVIELKPLFKQKGYEMPFLRISFRGIAI